MDDHICLCLPTAASLQLYAAAQAYISINQNTAQLLAACLSMSDSISRWKEGLLQRIRPFFHRSFKLKQSLFLLLFSDYWKCVSE